MFTFITAKRWRLWSLGFLVFLDLICVVECGAQGNVPDDLDRFASDEAVVQEQQQKLQLAQNEDDVFDDTTSAPSVDSSDWLKSSNEGETMSEFTELPSRNLDVEPGRGPPPSYSLSMDMTKSLDNPDELVDVKFNFDAESVVNVVQMFSLTLEFQYYIDPGVSGSVTMTIDTQMTRREAWELFEHILWITGSYASRQHKFIHILPFAKLPQERRIFAKHDPIPNVDVSVIRLFNVPAADMANLIRPFMTAGATANVIQHLNSLLIVEAPPNTAKIRQLIEKLDVLGETKWPQISIQLHHVSTDIILEELQQILPIVGFPVSSGERGDGHSIKLIALDRLQVLIAAAPTKEVLNEVKRWVGILDTEDTVEQERIFFYDVKYNNAEDLSDNVSVFFNSSGTSTGGRSRARSGDDETPRSPTDDSRTRRRTRQSQPPARRAASDEEKPATVFDIPVTILADGSHNRLVIKTAPRAYAVLEALLQRLDTPPLQVLIQVTIAQIELGKETEHGFRYAAAFASFNDSIFSVDIEPGDSDNPSGVDNPLYSLQFSKDKDGDGNINTPGEVLSFVQAVAGKTKTKILNAPQIVAISDEEASINVGDSVPIATRQDSGSDIDSRILTDVQYQDTGIILTVTPHITAKKLVTLDLRQEVSNAIETEVSSINSPTIQTRVIETSMIVEDGATILLGGLIQTERNESNIGLPVLKDVPYLGKLFGFTRDNVDRLELLLLITVNVIDLETDTELLLKRYNAAVEAINEEFYDYQNEIIEE